MNRFLVFWDSEFDEEDTAQTYADQASVHAQKMHKQLSAKLVDTRSNSPDKKYWNQPDTIECVTVRDSTKIDTDLNPGRDRVEEMVDNL